MGASDEPRGESADSGTARGVGEGAGPSKFAKVAKVAAAETVAEIVDGIVDDPFQSELTRHGGVMDHMIDTTHTAWHEATSAVHSTIHDHTDDHGHVADVAHDHAVDPTDHHHHDPHH